MKVYSPNLRKCSKNKTLNESFLFNLKSVTKKLKKPPIDLVGGFVMYFIQQTQKDDCGFACLKMILATLHKDKNYLFLPQDESHGLYSYAELIKIGKEHGVNFQPLKAMEKEGLINCSTFPFLATITLDEGVKHAVVVIKVKKKVTYIDPRSGKVTVSFKKFIEIWDGTGLFPESYEKMKYPYEVMEPIKTSSKVFLSLIQIIAGIFAILGVYFIKDDPKTRGPALFLALAIITELVMKAIAYSIMKKLDNYFFDEYRIPKKNYKDYIKRYEEYKRVSLSSPMNFLLIALFTLGLVAIVLLNDINNIMLVVVPLVLALFDAIFIAPMMKKKKHEIAQLEDRLDSAKTADGLRAKVKDVHTKAYNYSYIDIATRYLYAGVIVLTALLTMHICGISSFPYIIFYSCISLTLFKSLDSLLSFGDRIEEMNNIKVKLSNVVNRK